MDHIPTPRMPRYPPPQVYCFVHPDFDCIADPPFNHFPASRGWRLEAMIAGDFRQNHTEDERRSFFQEWLYFKPLAASFGAVGWEIDMDDFTRRAGGRLLVDSRNLIRYISEFERLFIELDRGKQQHSVRAIDHVLSTAQRLIFRECSMTSPARLRSETWPFDEITSMSFMVLGCTFTGSSVK
jgi:hypothetical protein